MIVTHTHTNTNTHTYMYNAVLRIEQDKQVLTMCLLYSMSRNMKRNKCRIVFLEILKILIFSTLAKHNTEWEVQIQVSLILNTTYIHTYIHTYIYIYIYIYMHVCMYMYACTSAYIYQYCTTQWYYIAMYDKLIVL